MLTVDLGGKLKAEVEIDYGEKLMEHLRNAPTTPHRTASVTIKIRDGKKTVGKLNGIAYCSPFDQFDKAKGKKLALMRAFSKDQEKKKKKSLLTKGRRRKVFQAIFPQYVEAAK